MQDSNQKTDKYWKEKLTQKQYDVLRKKGTEAPFSGEYDKHFEKGEYVCAACGESLFSSDSKYDAGCGWPSFSKPNSENNVSKQEDSSHGMNRTEVLCSKCGGHLGHVFDDGPADKGGQRYCINSASLNFNKK